MSPPATAIDVHASAGPTPVAVEAARPAPGRPLVVRDRVVRQLQSNSVAPVVLLTAPAGYGKTTVLRQWASTDRRTFHWLPSGSGRHGRRRWSALLGELIGGELGDDPCVVVLDGVEERIDAEGAQRIGALVDALPEGSVLAVASRVRAPLPLGRLRAHGELIELGPRDLALTRGEIATVFAGFGVRLGSAEIAAVVELTEGWPAVVSLLARATAHEHVRAPAVMSAALDPDIVEYFRDEVLTAVPEPLVESLARCSVLEELEPEACDALLDEPGSARWLAAVEDGPLPVTRVERTALRLRLHPIARAVLTEELQRHEPWAHRSLHRRASGWFAAREELDPALSHAILGRDLDMAGDVLWRMAQSAAWDGRGDQVDGWLRRLPAPDVEVHRGLAVAAAMAALTRLELAEAEHWLCACADATAGDGTRCSGSVDAGRAAIEGLLARDGLGRMRACAEWALAGCGSREPVHALGLLLRGIAGALAAEPDTAARDLEDGARRATAAAPGVAALCQAQLALMALAEGDVERGATLAERARARSDAVGLHAHPVLALVVAVGAFARGHRGRFAEARADVELALALAGDRDELPPWYAAQLALALGRAQLRMSEIESARLLLAEAARAASRLTGARALTAWIDAAAAQAHAVTAAGAGPAEPLTPAELRVLRFLPSHRSFREIGLALHVSTNTIKSQAHAVYRKLDASSRSAAVDRATALGLVDVPATASPGSGEAAAVGAP